MGPGLSYFFEANRDMRKAKGDVKKIEMEKEEGENDEGGEAGIGATLQALVASIATMNQAIVKIQEDIQEVKNDQKETKATMVAEVLPELQSEMRNELDRRDQQRDQQMQQLEQRFGRLGGASEAEFGETQQNLGHVLQTPGTSVDNGAQEEKLNHSGESAAKAWGRGGTEQVEAPTGNAGGEPAEELYENHLKTMNNVSLGMVDRSDIFYKTIQAELSTATGDLTSIVDIVARSMRSLLGLNRDGVQYISNCTTRAQILLLADHEVQSKHNDEGMSKADESVLAKCLSILRITTQRSTDDEVARQVAIHKLQVNKRSEKAFAFGQKFNACAGAALLALTHRLDQTMNKAAVLAMCSDSDNTVLGMDRALFDTMRRIYDSESITEDKIKRAVADVSRMSTKPRVDAGLAGCVPSVASNDFHSPDS